jgi:hypothetical protein
MEQEKKPFTPFTTEQKKEFAKQFTPKEIQSYHKGRRNAYSHMSNTARRESLFIQDNLNKNGTTAPPTAARNPAPVAPPPKQAKPTKPPQK